MARFNLQKIEQGNRFTLQKNLGLENIRVELTWENGDLDAQAWELGDEGLIVNDEGFVFYNSENRTEKFDRAKHGNKANYLKVTRPLSADGAVIGPKDELEGGIETINIDLAMVAPDVQEIIISATVYPGPEAKNFGDVRNGRITVIDENSGEPLCFYDLSSDFTTEDAMVVGSFSVNDSGDWEFEALGKGYNGGLQTLVEIYAS